MDPIAFIVKKQRQTLRSALTPLPAPLDLLKSLMHNPLLVNFIHNRIMRRETPAVLPTQKPRPRLLELRVHLSRVVPAPGLGQPDRDTLGQPKRFRGQQVERRGAVCDLRQGWFDGVVESAARERVEQRQVRLEAVEALGKVFVARLRHRLVVFCVCEEG